MAKQHNLKWFYVKTSEFRPITRIINMLLGFKNQHGQSA